jgi:hypothetical protein
MDAQFRYSRLTALPQELKITIQMQERRETPLG